MPDLGVEMRDWPGLIWTCNPTASRPRVWRKGDQWVEGGWVDLWKESWDCFRGLPRYADPRFSFSPDAQPEGHGKPISCRWAPKPRARWDDWQEEAAQKIAAEMRLTGAVQAVAPTGKGKTAIALRVLSLLGRCALVVVSRSELITDWRSQVELYTDLPPEQMGVVRGDSAPICELAVALTQSLNHRDYGVAFRDHWGVTAFDEAHRQPTETWLDVPARYPAVYRLGLTATPKRRDGMEEAWKAHCGPIVPVGIQDTPLAPICLQVASQALYESSRYRRWGGKSPDTPEGCNDARLMTLLAKDRQRNALIAAVVQGAAEAGRRVLVLSPRKECLHALADGMNGTDCALFTGDQSVEERRERRDSQVLLATPGVADTGINIPELDCLVLAGGVPSGRSLVLQSVGRILRDIPGKPQPLVLDIVDPLVPRLRIAAAARQRTYESQGWRVIRATAAEAPNWLRSVLP